ncbi:hypothetical protein OIU77_029788 [Salix suchowensis]|uniref:Uncharacterized protein n=1 Tax=Salix suchowensis TaxID=1278906 RepID=A0ABQ9B9Q4_9ROSI|nr:hypothetical protein OIU77_029788 [Salix suchowensis]
MNGFQLYKIIHPILKWRHQTFQEDQQDTRGKKFCQNVMKNQGISIAVAVLLLPAPKNHATTALLAVLHRRRKDSKYPRPYLVHRLR